MKKRGNMGEITFVFPRKTRPVSITGRSCSLSCAHCNGHYLGHMEDLLHNESPKEKDVNSFLVSGGCESDGAVPLVDHLDLLKRLSKKHRIVAHTGLIKKQDARAISPYVDAASFNMIGDDSTISRVYNLDKTTEDFLTSYVELKKAVRTYPHITLGIHKGELKGEYNAIDMLVDHGAEALVLNVFIPTSGTKFHGVSPPPIEDVMDVVSYTKNRLKDSKIYMGCMRPGGRYREKLDIECVKGGIDRIVMPSTAARQKAKSMGLDIHESMECCVL
jgi:uncharacterized radical SAM superfamily protein